MRSNLAFEAIQRKVADGDVAGARAFIPELLSPGDSYSLLADLRFQTIWPDVERWARATGRLP